MQAKLEAVYKFEKLRPVEVYHLTFMISILRNMNENKGTCL